MSVLVDSSVWIDFFRRGREGPAWPLDDLLARREVLTCGPVVAELLAGTSGDRSLELWETVVGIPWVELGRQQWRRIGELGSNLRASGTSIPLTDIEIAVAGSEASAAIWTFDTHFAKLVPLMSDLKLYER